MPEHKKPRRPEDVEVLQLIHAQPQGVHIMPVFFNGQERFALVMLMTNAAGQYVRLLGILSLPEDTIENGEGKPASFTPPMGPRGAN